MTYNFDEIIDRKNTYSAKWDGGPLFKLLGITEHCDDETLPLFTADMDFQCPDSVKQEVMKVAEHNLYGYTALHPLLPTCKPYYDAVCSWFKRRHNWEIDPQHIIYVDGTVTAIMHALLAYTKAGDGVLINRPIYTPFTRVILGTGREVVNSQLINNNGYYSIDFQDFEEKVKDPSVSCFILCNPHNPTGRIWSDEDLVRMYDLCTQNNVLVIADEIHGDLIRCDSKFTPLATLVDGDNLISCTAANKSFNLAGLKATNVVISNAELREKYMQQIGLIFSSPFTIAATIGAYNGGEEWMDQLKEYLDASFDWVLSFLKDNMPKVKCVRPEGTYILWMDFREYGLSQQELHNKIYVDANVVLEGGCLFDPDKGQGFERICLSAPRSVVQEAFERINKEFVGLDKWS